MRPILLLSAASLGFAAIGHLLAEPARESDADRITRLIRQLGDESFAKREAASKALEAIGEKALPALRKVVDDSDDPEISRRAERLVESIGNRKPDLTYKGKKDYTNQGVELTQHNLSVTNRDIYPDELFEPSPDLPAIGLNKQASRTIVEIYDGNDVRLYGFCALRSGTDLDRLWFAIRKGEDTPKQVYIILYDRKLKRSYKSNLINISE